MSDSHHNMTDSLHNRSQVLARGWQVTAVKNHPASIAGLQSGDVLVSRSTAVREHEIRIVPNAPHAVAPTHDAAVADGRAMAHTLGVDAWLSEDQTHVVRIAAHRAPKVVVEPSDS